VTDPRTAPQVAARQTPIRTAVIGFGSSGRVFHSPLIAANPDFSLDVVVTANAERRRSARTQYPEVRICAAVDELFDDRESIDLVVIGSPPATHVPLARRALQHDVAVVVDKPFCVRAGEGAQLADEADERGVLLTVFQNRRWDGDFLTVRELVRSGALGEVRRFESRFEWWKPDEPKVWKRESVPEEGGGMLYDLGTHVIDQALQLFGPIRDAYAELVAHRSPGTDDDSFVSLRHESGVRSQLWMNGMAAQAGPRFHVLGSESGYTKWGLDGQEAALKRGAGPPDPAYGVDPEAAWGVLGIDGALAPAPPVRGQYDTFYALLADAFHSGGPVPVDPRQSAEVIGIIEGLYQQHGVRRR
jgi:scyllo-inositol 2-dehydrogenase (NADP+)